MTSDCNFNLLQSSSVAWNFCILVYKRIWTFIRYFIDTYLLNYWAEDCARLRHLMAVVIAPAVGAALGGDGVSASVLALWSQRGRVRPGSGAGEPRRAGAQCEKGQVDLLLQTLTWSCPRRRAGAESSIRMFWKGWVAEHNNYQWRWSRGNLCTPGNAGALRHWEVCLKFTWLSLEKNERWSNSEELLQWSRICSSCSEHPCL